MSKDKQANDGRSYSEYSEYVAVGPHSYGRGFTEDDALENCVPNLPDFDRLDDVVTITIFDVPVDAEWSIGMYALECEAGIRSRQVYEMQTEDLEALADLTTEMALAVEEAFVNATEPDE